MDFTGQQCVDLARVSLNDAAKVRYTDSELLVYLNAGLGTFALVRPDLFAQYEPALATVANQVQQDVTDADALAIIDVYGVSGGNAITECDLETLSRSTPGWMMEAAGVPVHWMRAPGDSAKRDATKYMLYPRPKTEITLMAQVVYAPDDITLNKNVPVPSGYEDALAQYVVYKAESKDDEHVLSGRAQMALGFCEKVLGVSLQSKVVVKEGRPG
jgi:hypothetical protein